MYFFDYLLNTFGKSEKDSATFQAARDFDITAQILVQNSTGHKKESLKGYIAIFLAYLVTST